MKEPGADFRLWGGRFDTSPAAALHALNSSLAVDWRLWPYDVQACRAWVKALAAADLVTEAESVEMLAGLERVAEILACGLPADASDEDVHTLIERLLHESIGDLAGKLRTGRSRNDLVATDFRLWTIDALGEISTQLRALIVTLLDSARTHLDVITPGYTHGQQAQPVRWSHVLLAHAWPLVRDLERAASVRKRTSVLPLGSGALAGPGFPIDRDLLRHELGFIRSSANALDATGDRDFAAEALFVLALTGVHLSRLAAEFVIYSSAEFGFLTLADAYSTGSSLMPQKRNPDVFELVRGKAGGFIGDLTAMLTLLKGIPQGYQKDLQEDKSILFGAVDAMLLVLPAFTGAVATAQVNAERMADALDDAMKATDLADLLVRRGMAFDDAHTVVGALVRRAEERNVSWSELPEAEMRGIDPLLAECAAEVGTWEDVVERRTVMGGTSRQAVRDQLREARAALEEFD